MKALVLTGFASLVLFGCDPTSRIDVDFAPGIETSPTPTFPTGFPTSWAMTSPASGTSSTDSTPSITAAGGVVGSVVDIFSDSTCATVALGSGTVAFDGTLAITAFTLVTDATYTFYGYATSSGGSTACAPLLLSYTLDTTAPILASAAISNSSPTNTTTYSLTYGAVTGTYASYCILENSTTEASCTYTAGALPASFAVSVTENAKVLSVWLKDAAGNTSTRVDTGSVTLDSTAPILASAAISNTSPTATTTYGLTYGAVTGTYASYCILENSTTVGSCTFTAGVLPASYVVSATENAKVLSVWLKDSAGNISTRADTGSVTLDTTAPSTALTWAMSSPANGANSSDATPALSGTGAEASSTVSVYGDSSCATAVLNSGTAAGDGSFSISAFTVSTDGVKSFYFKITDPATNASACTTTALSYTYNTCVPSTLEWVSQPSATTAGSSIANFTVRLKDSGGNICTYSNESATISISDNPALGTLSGTSTVAFSAGIATFTGLSIDKAGTAYRLTAQSTGGLFSAQSSSFDITAAAASKLTFVQSPAGYANSTVFSPSLVVQVSDTFGNLVSSASTNVTLSIDTNPGGAPLGGTLTQATASGVATFNDLSIGTSANGYTLRAVSSAGGIADAVSSTFDIYGAGVGLNLEVPIEMMSYGFGNQAGAAFSAGPTWVSLNTNDYNGSPTYRLEIVASSTDVSNRNVSITDSAGNVLVNMRVPLSTPTVTRYTTVTPGGAVATFTPTAGSDTYRVRLPNVGTADKVRVYSARIIVSQTAATKTRIYIPLLSGTYDGISTTAAGGRVDQSTTTSTYGQNAPAAYALWKKVTSGLATLDPTTPFTFAANFETTTSGTPVYAALYNASTGSMVAGSEVTTSSSSIETRSASFLSSATNFTDNDNFEVRIKGTGSVKANLYHAGLWVKLINLTKAEAYYRILRQYTTASAGVLAYQRAQIPTGSFSNPIATMVCSGRESSAGTLSYKLFTAGTSDSAVAGSDVASGTVTFGSTTQSYQETAACTLNANDRYLIDFAYTSGTPALSQCLIKVSTQ